MSVPADSSGTRADSTLTRPDSVAAAVPPDTTGAHRVVREFPVIEVRALLHDLRSSETVHEIPTAALRAYPVDGLAQLVALQAGVVALNDELHVRGGRAGETLVTLDGLTLNEPLRHRPMELPLPALRSAELVSGAPESRYPGTLAGVIDVHTVDPGKQVGGEWRWQTDGGLDTRYDRLSGSIGGPVPLLGLGVVVAADATLDDTSLPALRSHARHDIAGVSFGWRAENRLLGYLKVAPVERPGGFAFQVLANRRVREPYDPAWSREGWLSFDVNGFPHLGPDPQPGAVPYRAADHLAMTDDRWLATLLSATRTRGGDRGTVSLGWLHARTSTGALRGIPSDPAGVLFDTDASGDAFHIIGGDDPIYRVSGSDVFSVRGDAEIESRGDVVRFGFGVTYEDLWLDELDATLHSRPGFPVDSFRTYHAYAPGGFAYGQGRWQRGGLVLNAGLRVELYTAGPQADDQTLPGSGRARLSLLPRFGIAYPISTRDVFSMVYVRANQVPQRDLLYDRRRVISNRQPLGNPALRPAALRSYEAALKHILGPTWAFQSSFFYRDAAHVAGARNYQTPGGLIDPRYTDEDQASAAGFELSVVHARDDRRRFEARYTFMHAWGYESLPEGDPYGPPLEPGVAPFGERPLSWDRRHAFTVAGTWAWRTRLSLAWSSVVGSPLPWTPKPRRNLLTDLTLVNSRRFRWTEITNLNVSWSPPYALGLTLGLEARNLFDERNERAATVDGFPNPVINTYFDDYGAYRTETGLGGGAYWTNAGSRWVPVKDARLFDSSRTLRMSVGRSW